MPNTENIEIENFLGMRYGASAVLDFRKLRRLNNSVTRALQIVLFEYNPDAPVASHC